MKRLSDRGGAAGTAPIVVLRALCLIALFTFLVSCDQIGNPPPIPTSLWGEIFLLGHTEQTSAPPLLTASGNAAVFWIGADAAGVHQDMRIAQAGNLSQTTVLPLPPQHPYGQQVALAGDSNTHLLWLDAGADNLPRLFNAVITPSMVVERGPLEISDRRTLHYAALPDGTGGLWIVWSGGQIAEHGLYLTWLDGAGLTSARSKTLAVSGDWPLIVSGSGRAFLFWLDRIAGRLSGGELIDNILTAQHSLTTLPELSPGDRLLDVRAGLDPTHAYIFWTITRATGGTETWYSAGSPTSGDWPAPVRLGVTPQTQSFTTGFNSGTAQTAQSGETWLTWAAPAAGMWNTLPVATWMNGQLAIVYFEGGVPVGWQDIAPAAGMIGPPFLVADRDLHLYLTWTDSTPQGYADLKLTMTRQS